MKKILRFKIILVILLSTSFAVHAQWINSITHSPANPTSADTIYFYADLSFPSGNCDEHNQFSGVNGQDVYAAAVHCIGSLTFICSYTDTFKIDPLPAGNYNFTLTVLYGSLPSPCNPTGNGATDSTTFTVTSATSVPFITNGHQATMILPNPASNSIKLLVSDEMTTAKNNSLIIYSAEGKEIRNYNLENLSAENEIDISFLKNGIYFCNLISENSLSSKVKLIVIK